MSNSRELLFFTSPIGLGHASRDIAIAEKLKQRINHEIRFVSGSSAHDLILKAGFPALSLYRPPTFTVESGVLRNSFIWMIRYITYYNKCKKIANEVIRNHLHKNPTIVSDEDFASLAVSQNYTLSKKVLIYDILESTTYNTPANKTFHYGGVVNKNNIAETHLTSGLLHIVEKKMNKQIRHLISKCDKVIIPDFGDNIDNLEFVGPIVREIKSDRKTLRNKLCLSGKTILVCTGGTDAGIYLIQKSLEAYKRLKNRFDLDLILVSGPSIKLKDFNCNCFRNLGFIDNLHEYIYASDLVISLAGRSTIDESIVYGTPGIFIPIKDHFEQEQNANKLGYKYEDMFKLDRLIEEKLGVNHQNSMQSSSGAEITAKILSELL